MSTSRLGRAKELEDWADKVDPSGLRIADTDALRSIADLVARRNDVNKELNAAVRSAREARRSWSEIGAMLGVSKQTAQKKYSKVTSSDSQPAELLHPAKLSGALLEERLWPVLQRSIPVGVLMHQGCRR